MPTPPMHTDRRGRPHGFTFDELGVDGADTTGIIFVCYEKRTFSLEIDEVELTPELIEG